MWFLSISPCFANGWRPLELAGICHSVIVVAAANESRWQVLHRTRDVISQAGAGLLGVVLNKREYLIPRWLYQTL